MRKPLHIGHIYYFIFITTFLYLTLFLTFVHVLHVHYMCITCALHVHHCVLFLFEAAFFEQRH